MWVEAFDGGREKIEDAGTGKDFACILVYEIKMKNNKTDWKWEKSIENEVVLFVHLHKKIAKRAILVVKSNR